MWYDVGSKHEPRGKTGFAHLFEHLMFNGSENSPGEFFEPLKEARFGDWQGEGAAGAKTFAARPRQSAPRILLIDRPDSTHRSSMPRR